MIRQLLIITLALSPMQLIGQGVLLDKTELIFQENFDGGALSPDAWKSSKAKTGFSVKNGQYHWDCEQSNDVKKRVSLQHGLAEPIGDLVLEYTFTPGPGFTSAIAAFNDEHGHCLVKVLAADKLYAYKFPSRNKTRDFAEYADATGASLQAGTSYAVRIEISGPRFVVLIDNQHFLMGENERFRNPKMQFHFSFQGKTGTLDNIRLWSGKPKKKPNWQDWLARKDNRRPLDYDKDPLFKKKKNLSDARVALKDNPQYQLLVSSTATLMTQIKAAYPFFGSPRKNDKKKHSHARKNDPAYLSQLNKLKAKQQAELHFIATRRQNSQ